MASRGTGKVDARQRYVVPGATVPLHEKTTQRRTGQNLPGAAAPVVNLASVADRIGMGPDHDLQAVAPALRIHVDIDDDTEERLDLVGDLREQLARTAHADHIATIIPADTEDTALGVGESTDPLQVRVTPGRLPFDVL